MLKELPSINGPRSPDRRANTDKRSLAALATIAKAAINPGDLAEFLDLAVREVAAALEVETALVLFRSKSKNMLTLTAATGVKGTTVGTERVLDGSAQAQYVLDNEDSLIVASLSREDRFRPSLLLVESSCESGIDVLIPDADGVYGILRAYSSRERIFGPADTGFLEGVANIIGAVVARRNEAQQARKLLRAIEQSPVSVVMTDNTGSIEYVNPKFTDVTGYSAEEALGQNPRILKSGYTCRKDYESLWATILTGHIWRGTLQNKAKDGHLFWEDAQIAPVRDHDGDITHFVAIKEDITERVETQERMQAANKALRESEDNLRRVFSTIQDGIFVIKNNLFTLVNESFASMVGLTPDAMIGSDWTEFLHEDDLPDLLKFRKGLKGQLTGHEVRLRQQDGGVRHVELWAALATGFAKGADTIGTVKDLTEKRQADAEKMEFEVRLNHANKMEAIGTLAGGIAHDFNNILGAISGFAHLALQSAPADSPLAEDIGDILQASDRAVGLIRQILNFSRRADVDEQPVNVTEIVEEAIQLLRASIPKTIRLTSYTDSRPKMVLANPSQIHQVILNLCTNAASAIEDNSGDIRVQLNEIEINNEQDIVRAGLPQGSYAKLVVSDTGTGVDDDTLPRLFEPYFTTKAEGQGTGMGLAVVHGIIQSCGGSIHVGKAANGDTAFSVLLPLIEAEQQAAKITPGALPLGQGRILWIDDERAITRIAKRVLGQLGYTVETADSAAAALEILHDRLMEFDLIITDQSMPGMTGMELAVEVLGKRPDLPIILCSGFAGKLSEEDTKEAGIAEFIWKPFIPSELANIVYEVLQKQENQKT